MSEQYATLFDPDFDRRLEMARDHVAAHHGWQSETIKDAEKRHSGFITLAVRKTDAERSRDAAQGKRGSAWIQRHFDYDDLQRNLPQLLATFADRDVYMLANTVYKPRRVAENLRQYRCLWADLDCYKIGMRAVDVLNVLERDVFGKTLPWPSRVVFSGGEHGGLWLFWDIEPVPHHNRAWLRWRAVQRQFNYMLREYGADPQALDPVRVVRLAGTYNSKTGDLAECLVYDDESRYSLEQLAEEHLPRFEADNERPQRVATTKRRRTRSADSALNYFDRLRRDLVTLCDLRGWNVKGDAGRPGREYLLFLYRHFSEQAHGDRERALEETVALNQRFTDPLPDAEIRDTKARPDVVYRYKRQTLIDLFGITPEEQRHMSALVGDDLRRDRQRVAWREYHAEKRAEAGVVPRAVQRDRDVQTLANAIKDAPDASLRALALSTGFSKDKCARLLDEAKERLSQDAHSIIVQLCPPSGSEQPSLFYSMSRSIAEVAVASETTRLPRRLSRIEGLHGRFRV